MTNEQFGARVGCDFTMASRLRNGRRLPSGALLVRIHDEFRIPWAKLMDAYKAGAPAFGQLLSKRIFKDA